jgi:hypothetical protein
MRSATLIAFLIGSALQAQPDTLYVPSGDTVFAFAVVYDPVEPAEQYRLVGRFAHNPEQVAVHLDHKRGKPCGVYRAWYPNGTPLIFAVYGWGFLHGDWTEYDEYGRVAIKGQYRQGLRDGTWSFRQEGLVGSYRKGLKHGKWKTYRNGRVVLVEKFRDGELVPGGTFRFQ